MRAGVPEIGLTIVAIFGALTIALGVALAQEDYASTSSNPTDELLPASELSPEESAILGNALTFGPSTLNNEAPVKPLRLPRLSCMPPRRNHWRPPLPCRRLCPSLSHHVLLYHLFQHPQRQSLLPCRRHLLPYVLLISKRCRPICHQLQYPPRPPRPRP